MAKVCSKLSAALAVGLACFQVQAQEAVEWPVSEGGNGHWYQAVRPSPMPTTLEGQAQYAQSRGATMATLTSPEENQFVMAFLQLPGEVNGMFFGLSRTGSVGAWTWSDGQPLGWSFWGGPSCAFGPYPNNAGQPGEWVAIYYLQNCGPVWDDAPPSWYTDSCANVRLLLEWSADCNGDGVVDYGQIRSSVTVAWSPHGGLMVQGNVAGRALHEDFRNERG